MRTQQQFVDLQPERDTTQIFKLGELFSGSGGMALGAHLAGNGNAGFQHI